MQMGFNRWRSSRHFFDGAWWDSSAISQCAQSNVLLYLHAPGQLTPDSRCCAQLNQHFVLMSC